jgi:hypothetical protein
VVVLIIVAEAWYTRGKSWGRTAVAVLVTLWFVGGWVSVFVPDPLYAPVFLGSFALLALAIVVSWLSPGLADESEQDAY